MIKLKNILTESIVGNKIVCDNCNWSWDIKDGGDDLYMCHKCGHNNTPKLTEQSSKITNLFIGQPNQENWNQTNIEKWQTKGEKYLSSFLKKIGAIDIVVTNNMSTSAVTNEIKKLAIAGALVSGKLESVTIVSHRTGCGRFNYGIMYSSGGGAATEFWKVLSQYCNSNTKIFLGGCSVAEDPSIIAKISKITNCTVTAPTGTYFPGIELVTTDDNKFNISKRVGKYITCTNNPSGDKKYENFINKHKQSLFADSKYYYKISRKLQTITKFHDELNYISPKNLYNLRRRIFTPPLEGPPPAYRYLKDDAYKKEINNLMDTLIETMTVKLIQDYIKSIGCVPTKTNPIQGTRSAIFK